MARGSSAETSLDAYASIFGVAAMDRIRDAAASLQGARVLHLSLSRSGSHHSRMLHAAVPLLTNLGIDVRWSTASAIRDDAAWSHSLHEAMEGEGKAWHDQFGDEWHQYARAQAAVLSDGYDFIVVHDAQLLPIRAEAERLSGRTQWVWHCHMDLRDCDDRVAHLLSAQLARFDVVAVEHPDFAGAVSMPAKVLIPAVIDPLSGRNAKLPPTVLDSVLRRFDLKPECPLVVEVSPFDGWDDPQWAIHTYQVARKHVPDLQLALVATSDESRDAFTQINLNGSSDGVRLLHSPYVGDVDINALQGAATVAMQNAVRKGFSTALLEASWKGRPVLACEGGAMAHQVVDGTSGYLFRSFDDAADHIVELVKDRNLADALGFNGHRLVRDNHLVVRWVEEYMKLLGSTQAVA